jgi:hypothetical protein
MQVSLPDVVLAEGVKQLEADSGEGKAGKVYGAKQLVYRLGSAAQVCNISVGACALHSRMCRFSMAQFHMSLYAYYSPRRQQTNI